MPPNGLETACVLLPTGSWGRLIYALGIRNMLAIYKVCLQKALKVYTWRHISVFPPFLLTHCGRRAASLSVKHAVTSAECFHWALRDSLNCVLVQKRLWKENYVVMESFRPAALIWTRKIVTLAALDWKKRKNRNLMANQLLPSQLTEVVWEAFMYSQEKCIRGDGEWRLHQHYFFKHYQCLPSGSTFYGQKVISSKGCSASSG